MRYQPGRQTDRERETGGETETQREKERERGEKRQGVSSGAVAGTGSAFNANLSDVWRVNRKFIMPGVP